LQGAARPNVDPGYRYARVQTAVIYTSTWEVNKTLQEVPGQPPTVVKTGEWGISFWTPLSAFGLNQRIAF
jgi:hypothetical protein